MRLLGWILLLTPMQIRGNLPADVPDLLLSVLQLGCRRTPTPARVAGLGSVAPLTQLNPESNYILPKNKHRVTPSRPSVVISVFFFSLSMGPNLPYPDKVPQSMRCGLGGICGCDPPVCSALLCAGGSPLCSQPEQ